MLNNYLYRYRSLNNPFIFQELENLEIYFAKSDELNDQMEDYMNLVWEGDEIAFRGLFKHYIYTLASLYYDIRIRDKSKKIDPDNLPVFNTDSVINAPEMETTFKEIYHEFFNCEEISKIPALMESSNKKYTIDEMLCIFNTIHLYAYFVIDSIIQKKDRHIDVLVEKEYKETYNELKYSIKYSDLISFLIKNSSNISLVRDNIMRQEKNKSISQKYINELYKDKDPHNINILSFDFPNIYLKNIKKLIYNNFCLACFSRTYKNEPMWSHYADSENGICLKFKTINKDGKQFINLYSSCKDKTPYDSKKEFYYHDIVDVIYSDEYPEIDFFSSLGCLTRGVIEKFWLANYDGTKTSSCLKYYDNHLDWYTNYHKKAKEYICTKARNWSYEQECRVFLYELLYPAYEKVENRIAKYKIQDLEAIIFGRKVSLEDKRKVVEIISKHCFDTGIQEFKFYDLYYSTVSKQLELKRVVVL